MIPDDYKNWKERKPKPDKMVKDSECAKCSKWLSCKGKPRGTKCVMFEERS